VLLPTLSRRFCSYYTMQFGWLPPEELAGKTFKLPPDGLGNRALLAAALPAEKSLYVGCAEWRVKEWKGRLYPTGVREADMMAEYVARYAALEFNGTHYRIYRPEEIRRWTEKAGDNPFLFLPKFPQTISHQSGFVHAGRDTTDFLEGVEAFGKHLGPLFVQVSEFFAPTDANQQHLYQYLASLPAVHDYFLELRHPDWFTEPVLERWTSVLRELKIGAVITDTPGRHDVCHMQLTIPKTFIRFVGKSRVQSTYERIEDWAKKLHQWREEGLTDAYFIVHCALSAPEMSRYAIARINAHCGTTIAQPQLTRPLFDPFTEAIGMGLLPPGEIPQLPPAEAAQAVLF
jgi:uncharacterized protein YecE (DUF72 family)